MVIPGFSIPIGLYNITADEINNETLVTNLRNYKKINTSEPLLYKGITSYFDNSETLLNETNFISTGTALQNKVYEYCSTIGIPKVSISSSWFHITQSTGIVLPHRHELSVISGVYYPVVNDKTSPLILENPLNIYRMVDCKYNVENNYTRKEMIIQPENGLLVLFSSYINHYTKPCESERITIAFDTIYEEKK